MLGNLLLLGNTERKIELQTRLGSTVRNAIDLPPEQRHIDKFHRLLAKHQRWQKRLDPIGGYNCVGHVWASRRTSVFDDSEIRLIFKEDGYRVAESGEKLYPGDLIAYWSLPDKSKVLTASAQALKQTPPLFLHVGLIVNIEEAEGFQASAPHVLSKFDSTSGEVVHHFLDVEFPGFGEFSHEFWTERPRPTERKQ